MSEQATSRELMFTRIREWQGSGLSQKAFCEQYQIGYSHFHYWYRRFRETDGPRQDVFVAMKAPIMGSALFASITFPNGQAIAFHQAVSPDYLIELLK